MQPAFNPVSTGVTSLQPNWATVQAIDEVPTISEAFEAVQGSVDGNGIIPFPTEIRSNQVADSVLNELVYDAVILQSHKG